MKDNRRVNFVLLCFVNCGVPGCDHNIFTRVRISKLTFYYFALIHFRLERKVLGKQSAILQLCITLFMHFGSRNFCIFDYGICHLMLFVS
jgi:hypothetical protein